MDDALLLNTPWPDDLDPADVPFRTRTVTVLCWLDGKHKPQGPRA